MTCNEKQISMLHSIHITLFLVFFHQIVSFLFFLLQIWISCHIKTYIAIVLGLLKNLIIKQYFYFIYFSIFFVYFINILYKYTFFVSFIRKILARWLEYPTIYISLKYRLSK